MANVKNLLNVKGRDIWFVAPSTSIRDALRLMAEKNIGAVPVLEGDRVVGIFSERDYARFVASEDQLLLETPVRNLMTSSVYIVHVTQTIEECMALMTAKHIRHLPVMEGDRLIGMISIGDVVKSLLDEKETVIQGLENYILGRDYSG